MTTLSPLDHEARAKIIALHTGRIGTAYGVEIETVDASFINQALRLWETLQKYGTREIIRWIEEATADQLIQAKADGVKKVRVAWTDERVEVGAA